MNLFQAQMLNDIKLSRSIRKQTDTQREVESLTGEKFPSILKQQAGYPLENKK